MAVPGQADPVATINDVLLTSLPVSGHKIAGKKIIIIKKKLRRKQRREGGDTVRLKAHKTPKREKVKHIFPCHFAET